MSLYIEDLVSLLQYKGHAQYGNEEVSQLEHALQCAHLAEQAGEPAENIVAALLHDVGHLLANSRDGESTVASDKDDLHQYIALPFLRNLFPDAVLEPIRLHVDAKRYLCAVYPSYWDELSDASKHSLAQQGGAFTETQAQAFIALPFAEDSVRLRRYDDLAKIQGKRVPELNHYADHIAQVML